MKRKYIVLGFFLLGVGLIGLSFVLTFAAASNIQVIGGAGLPTFLYVLRREHRGLYFYLAFGGVLLLLVSAVFGILKRKQ